MSPLVKWYPEEGAWREITESVPGGGPDPLLYGWNLTTSNTGLSASGVDENSLTPLTISQYGGAFPNFTGMAYRRRIDLGWNTLAPASDAMFIECLITGSNDLVNLFGNNIYFKNCNFHITEEDPMSENVHINGNYAFVGSGARVFIEGCEFTGGHIFINLTSMGGDVIGCYGHSQSPEVGGGQHRDGFTSRGASSSNPIVLDCVRFDCDQNSTTGAFFLQDTYGSGVSGIEVRNSLFEGSGYCVAIENSSNLTFVNNRMRPHGPHSYGPVVKTGDTSTWTWEENYLWQDTPPDYRGAPIL